MSGAFGGLIAFGLIRIETGSLVGWQYLYIVEGSLSVLAGPLAYFWIPRELPKAWFYNAEEKVASAKRADALIKANHHTDKFSWTEVFKGLTAWQVRSLGINSVVRAESGNRQYLPVSPNFPPTCPSML